MYSGERKTEICRELERVQLLISLPVSSCRIALYSSTIVYFRLLLRLVSVVLIFDRSFERTLIQTTLHILTPRRLELIYSPYLEIER